MPDPIVRVTNLQTHFRSDGRVTRAVDGVSFSLYAGKTLALVGESGCGKSVTSLSLMRLVPEPPGKIVAGEAILTRDGSAVDLFKLPERDMRQIRGRDIAMIFQEPMTSLNPVFTIGWQLIEAIQLHTPKRGAAARDHAAKMLAQVGIPSPELRLSDYPHQLSGGMRQRVMIAMALSCEPKVLIADEPTTALDVTIQAQILELLRKLQQETGLAVLMITHDLGVVADLADDVAVMYSGRIVETAPTTELFANPRHPYTQGLMSSIPRLGRRLPRLSVIPGVVADPAELPEGCKFQPRCYLGKDRAQCIQQEPTLLDVSREHTSRCWYWEEAGQANIHPAGTAA